MQEGGALFRVSGWLPRKFLLVLVPAGLGSLGWGCLKCQLTTTPAPPGCMLARLAAAAAHACTRLPCAA